MAVSNPDRTFAFTFGPWGGVWFKGGEYCWRLSLGFLAVTYFNGEFAELLKAWLDAPDTHERIERAWELCQWETSTKSEVAAALLPEVSGQP